MDEQFWNQEQKRWNSHAAFKTVSHDHVACYRPAPGHKNCDLMLVECHDGRWYVEDNWGSDAHGAEKVWNPFIRNAEEPHFFATEAEAMALAVSVVARVSGVQEDTVGGI